MFTSGPFYSGAAYFAEEPHYLNQNQRRALLVRCDSVRALSAKVY